MTRLGYTVLTMAKAPVPGQVKTRLCPPLLPTEAAQVAAAALLDTLAAVTAAGPATRSVVALAGNLADARRPRELQAALTGSTVIAQAPGSLGDRLAAAHQGAAGHGPVLQIGMDTPQLTPIMLTAAAHTLRLDGVDAVLGPAADGGWWSLGLRDPQHAEILRQVEMSRPDTGHHTLQALRRLGLRVALLPMLTDVDTFPDAARVATLAPGTRFARTVRDLLSGSAGRAA